MKALLKRIARRLLAPFQRVLHRFVEARLRESEKRIVDRLGSRDATGSESAAIPELLTHLGQRLRQLTEETRRQGDRIEALEKALRAPGSGGAAPRLDE